MKQLLFLFAIVLGALVNTQAQVAADALRYSYLDVGGTARTVAIGGGIGALGADFSVISTNPAGLATFRRSEFTMTPSLFLTSTDAKLESGSGNPTTSENKTSFNFNNLGLVFAKPGRKLKWKTSNIAIGLNRVANFHQKISYNGVSKGSYVDFFQEASIDVAAEDLSNFTTGLAFDVGAIYDIDDDLFYETDVELNEDALISKSQTITRKGSINELAFAMAGNYNDRLMIGFTVGIPILSYTEKKEYLESDENDEVPAFRSLQFDESLKTKGSGINIKLGAIIRISQMFRVGAAIHTPSTFLLEDKYETRLLYNFVDNNNDGSLESSSPNTEDQSPFEYNYKTPWRYIGSLGIIIKKMGFISGEVEYVNYGGSSFDLTRNDNSAGTSTFEQDLNNEIANIYQSAINIRLGGEFAYKIFRFRGGINLSGTPYADNNITNKAYSLGFGIRKNKFFTDFAYKFIDANSTFEPYTVSNFYPQNSVSLSTISNSALLTFGFKF